MEGRREGDAKGDTEPGDQGKRQHLRDVLPDEGIRTAVRLLLPGDPARISRNMGTQSIYSKIHGLAQRYSDRSEHCWT